MMQNQNDEENYISPKSHVFHPQIFCLETGKTYRSYTAAADDTGCSRWGVKRCCEGIQVSTNDKHFWYEETDLAQELIDKMIFPDYEA
jgi:hypothetical protein